MNGFKIEGWKIVLTIFLLCILSVPAWFVYTRFCLDIYQLNYVCLDIYQLNYDGNKTKLTLKDVTYVETESYTGDIGKAIGVATYKKRELKDLIWPIWVVEYRDDKEHNRVFVQGLMDVGNTYVKVPK